MGRPLIWLAAILVLAFACAPAWADDDDLPGSTNLLKRPIEELFKTDVVYPQEKGEFELELASLYQNHAGADTWTIPVSMEYGLNDRWQMEAEWNSLVQRFPQNHSAVRGVGDLELGTQYSFMNIGDSGFHVAPRFSLEVPVGDVDRDLSEGFLEYEPALILAKDVPELHRTQFFTELGASLAQRIHRPKNAEDAEPSAHELNLGAGFFVLFAHTAPTLEFNAANSTWNHHGTENDLYLTPGFLWRVNRKMELGLGVPVGLNKSSDRFELAAHCVWEF